jgi:glucose-6-phosphate dehydrogenase assembly protein OpcA
MAESNSISLGLPVDIGSIDRELKKLWDDGQGALTRASLVNFAVYCHGSAMAKNTELISKLMRNHACRAILIGVEPALPEIEGISPSIQEPNKEAGGGRTAAPAGTQAKVQAWINAHCHITREGAKQVCCEQLSFLLEGDAASLVPNIVFSHLDSDLPLYLWWQGDFTEICNNVEDCHPGTSPLQTCACAVSRDFQAGVSCQSGADLWPWVDRLFFDSLDFSDPLKQFCYLRSCILRQPVTLHAAGAERYSGTERLVLCDLNWGRSLFLRQTIAQIFEAPENLQHLKSVQTVRVACSPKFRSTAALFAGWILGQLGSGSQKQGELRQVDADTVLVNGVKIQLQECLPQPQGDAISECEILSSNGATFRLSRPKESAYWHADIHLPGGCEFHHLYPAGCTDTLSLLDEELMLGGKHLVYLKALAGAEPFLS